MSIAVRASVLILGLAVVVSATLAVWALLQRQTLQGQVQNLESKISDDQSRMTEISTQAQKLKADAAALNDKITQMQQDKSQIQSQSDELKHKSDDLQSQLEQANTDRDDWKNRVNTMQQERDSLMQKLKQRPTQIVYKDRIMRVATGPEGAPSMAPLAEVTSPKGDQYWASVLKQKAALQVELQKESYDLNQAALQVVDLKKQNSDLEMEIKKVVNEKDEIVQKIKYGEDLADNLSIDLARSRNDQKAISDRADRLKEENLALLSQIRELTTAKLELERSVSRLTDDKDAMQKKLIETESVIQSRIDDIWKIKASLDKRLAENAPSSTSAGGMELPPIIVNAPNNQQQAAPLSSAGQAPPVAGKAAAIANAPAGNGKTEGTIISINESNNFVIVDLGQENSSVSVGIPLKVYRDSNGIADLQIIQVRRDICAADIKNKTTDLKVGDVVRFN